MGVRSIRIYDKEFKNNAIDLYLADGGSYKVVADRLGIPCATLVGWIKAREKFGSDAFPGKGHLKPEEEKL